MPTVSRGTIFSLSSGVSVLEDFADRLSHVWTFWLLLILAAVVSWKQQSYDSAIQCLTPSDFTEANVEYAHTTCWSGNERFLKTYKWLPVILCIQALLFKLPNIIMHVLHGHSGVSFDKIAGLTAGYQNLNLMERSYLGKQTGRYLYNWCKQYEKCLPFRVLSIVWCLVKLLFCVNVIVQAALIGNLLAPRKFFYYGHDSKALGSIIYRNLFDMPSRGWTETRIFPRRFTCSYSVQRGVDHSLECALPVNEFNEYIYMGLWIWLLIVAVISCLSFVVWLIRTVVPIFRQRYISRMLELSYDLDPNQLVKTDVAKLVEMMGEDGVMVLKLIASNSSEFVVRDTVTTMFQMKNNSLLNVPEVTPYPAVTAPAPVPTQAGIQSPVDASEKA